MCGCWCQCGHGHRVECEVSTWSEPSEAIAPRVSPTERARAQAALRVGRDGESVAAVARAFDTDWISNGPPKRSTC
jgi:hypothetical protein